MRTLTLLALALLAGCSGCSGGGPPSTATLSTSLPTLQARVEFLHRYVTFR